MEAEKMNKHTCISILTITVAICSLVFAAATAPSTSAGSATTAGAASAASATFPYTAEITGDAVNVRSGAGQPYYECGQLNKGERVQVIGSEYTWSKIKPPTRCYSLISSEYVKPDPENPGTGIVTGENVRVYAGSDSVKPIYSTSLQLKLNKGDKVKLLGAEVDKYYKITPPDGAYLWVSTSFTRPVAPDAVPAVGTNTTTAIKINVAPAIDANATKTTTDANATKKSTGVDANGVTTPLVQTPMDKYKDLKKQVEQEQAKPFEQQNYSTIKEGLNALAADKATGNVARYAQAVLEQIATIELAMNAQNIVKQQSETLTKTQEQINKEHLAALATIKDLGKYAVMGKLQKFAVFGTGYYRILDETGKTICTISPALTVKDYGNLLGKKVGVVGTIEPNSKMGTAEIKYSEIITLE